MKLSSLVFIIGFSIIT